MVGVKRALAVLVPCAALMVSGCDLLEDATSFKVCTNWEKVSVDTAQIGLSAGGATVPDVPCTAGGTDVCAQATAGISCSGGSYECKVQCGGSAKCEVEATAEAPPKPIDLSSKIQNSMQASALDKVSLDSVEYRVASNSLNFATPSISVYVGPNSATKVGDSGVTLFATMPPIPAKGTPSAALTPTAAGQSALTGFVKNYKTPFKILSSATMTFKAGDTLPEGKLDAELRSCFKISPL
jgi:hypothetical protein